jgi:hypothetical protein
MDNYQLQLIWQGQPIGLFDNPIPDMYYLEGCWLPNQTEAAAAFEKLAKQLDSPAVYHDWDNGIEIIIKDADKQTRALVFGLSSENLLFVRKIIANN